jgi:hypothetical protein
MKKSINLVLAAAMTLGTFTAVAAAAPNYVSVVLDGKKVYFPDAQPFIDGNGRTLVPVRFVTESLGAGVNWLGETQTVAIAYQGKDIRLKIGESKATVNGSDTTLDTQVILKGNRTFVPLRFVSESLNAKVSWDGNSSTVGIQTAASAGSTAQLDPFGRKIRTTNLPSNAQDYAYILEDIPNDMYEMPLKNRLPKNFRTPVKQRQDVREYADKHVLDLTMDRIRKHYSLLLNVDYRTIDYSWADEIYQYRNTAVAHLDELKNQVDWIKSNQIQMEGYLDPEPSMIYDDGVSTRVRCKLKFRINSFNEYKDLIYDVSFPFAPQWEKGVWYEGYTDIKISTNVMGDWSSHLYVDSFSPLFANYVLKKQE